MAIRTKTCCTTYKNICTYQKKAVPLQREKINKIYDVLDDCINNICNYYIINMLYCRDSHLKILHTPN